MGLFARKLEEIIFGISISDKEKSNYIYTLAEARAMDIIARLIASREIEVFARRTDNKKIEAVKNELYWALNIEPNPNESGSRMLYKFIIRLLVDKKALIIVNNNFYQKTPSFFVADYFDVDNQIMKKKTYYNIKISDSMNNSITLNKTYTPENAMFFSIKNTEIEVASDGFKINTKKILNATQKKYTQSNFPKWRLKTPGGQPKIIDRKTGQEINYDQYKQTITNGLTAEEESIIMLSEIFGLENLNKDNNQSSSDLFSVYKEIGDEVACKWGIPLEIYYGKLTEKSNAINDFVTIGLNYYFNLIEDELNRCLVGKEDYISGEYIKFNKLTIKHKDILDSANNIDKLTGDGFSRNEINKFFELPYIDEAWANEHNLTKNYGNYSQKKGGEKE